MSAELKPLRPILRYHGGKFLLAPWVVSHFPSHRVYTEAYGGAASVLIHKSRTYAEIYNDRDGEICGLFRVLRDPSQSRELKRQLELTPFARREFEESYVAGVDPIEQARRTVVRSFMGFGSAAASGQSTGFRNDANRSGTTPARDWQNYPAALDFFTERLRGVVIENRNACELIADFDKPETLHYVDPPYVSATRSGKKRVSATYRFEMSDADHRDLASTLQLAKGMVILSGYRCDLYDQMFSDWKRIERPALADGARPRVECLWLNASAHERRISEMKQPELRFATV